MNIPFISVVKNVNFMKLWLAQITSQVSLNMLSFVLAIRVYQVTHSNTFVSLLLLAFGIPSLIFGVAAGSLVDYFDKRKVLIFCNLSRMILFILFFFFSGSVFWIFGLTILLSIITQFFIPAEAPSIGFLVKQDLLLSANSLFTITFYLSTIIGFVFAGPAIRIFGSHNVFIVMTILMGLATFFVLFLPQIHAKYEGKRDVFNPRFIIKTVKDGFKFIKSNLRIEQSLLLLTFSQALVAILGVLAPGFSDKVLAIDLADASYLVIGPTAVGLILGAFLVGTIGPRLLKGILILIGLIGIGIVLILLSLIGRGDTPTIFIVNNLVFAMLLLFLLGIFNSLISVPANTILQVDSDSLYRGRVYGILTSMTGGASLLPVVTSGIIADMVGVERALLIIGMIVFSGGIYQYLQRRKEIRKIGN